mmetsp:Transcript_125217/g.217008  ORF Transcript_125217/g.217008 Transcript_125217/m.217008 type:complete len:696 (-) Transcript_125217:166-2253(-)
MLSMFAYLVFVAGIVPAMAGGSTTVELYRDLFTTTLLLVIVFFGVFWFLKFHLIFPSETAVAMAIGIGFAAIARACNSYEYSTYSALIFAEPFFTSLILPTVMISFGYNTRWRIFRLNKFALTAYSMLSMVLNFAIFTGCFYAIQKYAPGSGWPTYANDTQIMWISLFGATLITAVEPDALLSFMFEKYELDENAPQPVLYPLLKWEMILTTSTMFDSAEILVGLGGSTFTGAGDLLGQWVWKVVVSALLGVIAGLIFGVFAALYFKYCDMRDMHFVFHELALLLIIPYFCYWTCQFISFVQPEIRVAAPLATVVCACVMGNVVWKNLSEGARYHFEVVTGGLGHLAEMYNYAILGATLFYLTDIHTWTWSYIFTILGLKYGSRLFVIPLPKLIAKTIKFGTPTRYEIVFPEYARHKLTPEECAQVTRIFIVHDQGNKGYLTCLELQNLLLDLGHMVSISEVWGLMTVVDENALDEMSLAECQELFERCRLLEPGATLAPKKGWGTRTGLLCWLGGVQGHIAFGGAWLAATSGIGLMAGATNGRAAAATGSSVDVGVSPMLSTAWMLVAIGVFVQGSLSPLILKLFGVVPKEHNHQHNEHEYYPRPGLQGLLTHPTKLMTRHAYMKACLHELGNTDERMRTEEKQKTQKDLAELDQASMMGLAYPGIPGCDMYGGYGAPFQTPIQSPYGFLNMGY